MGRTAYGPPVVSVSGIVEIDPHQLPAISEIHRAAFPHSALSKLGQEAVCRYYDWLLRGPHDAVALGAEIDGRLVAFFFGGTFKEALFGYLRKNRLFIFRRLALHPLLLTDPMFREPIRHGIRSLRPRRKPQTPTKSPTTIGAGSFGVLSIAAHPDVQGTGAAQSLLDRAEEIARELGYDGMHLTVAPSNSRAVAFYERNQWIPVMTEDHWTGAMCKTLS